MEARFPLRAPGCGGASVMGGVILEGSWNPCQSIVSKWRKQDSSAGFRDKAWKADGTNRIGYFDLDMKGSVASYKHPFVQASLLRRLLYATLKNTEVKSKKICFFPNQWRKEKQSSAIRWRHKMNFCLRSCACKKLWKTNHAFSNFSHFQWQGIISQLTNASQNWLQKLEESSSIVWLILS